MKMKKLLCAILMTVSLAAHAQCDFRNTAFKGGEFLSYNLYYNWQFVWVKVGNASMSIVETKYKGQPAYRASLLTRGNQRADKLFVMRDTLLAYCSKQLAPLYFRKGAFEGKRYTVDEVYYSYRNGRATQKQHRQKHDGSHVWANHDPGQCVYDMLNIFLRARSFDPANWKKGYVVDFPIADGAKQIAGRLKFSGRSTVKADNGKKYKCLELSYMEQDKGKWKEIVRFFVTDDTNHIPIRLDLYLRFGSAKAFLVGMKGVRGAVTAEQ